MTSIHFFFLNIWMIQGKSEIFIIFVNSVSLKRIVPSNVLRLAAISAKQEKARYTPIYNILNFYHRHTRSRLTYWLLLEPTILEWERGAGAHISTSCHHSSACNYKGDCLTMSLYEKGGIKAKYTNKDTSNPFSFFFLDNETVPCRILSLLSENRFESRVKQFRRI